MTLWHGLSENPNNWLLKLKIQLLTLYAWGDQYSLFTDNEERENVTFCIPLVKIKVPSQYVFEMWPKSSSSNLGVCVESIGCSTLTWMCVFVFPFKCDALVLKSGLSPGTSYR